MASRTSLLLIFITISTVSSAPRFRRSIDGQTDVENESNRQGKLLNFNEDQNLDSTKPEDPARPKNLRKNKALNFFGYLPEIFDGDDYGDDFVLGANDNSEEDDLSRTIPSRRKQNPYKDFSNTNSLGFENSPIYYIRLPPTPYMFVPGLGYVSNPPSIGPPMPQVNPFINLPLDFVSNGKPTGIYQWTAPTYPTQPVNNFNPYRRPQKPNNYNYQRPTSNKKPITDSKITTLNKGPYVFNGKPTDIFVLRDSYNSLYSDALQNFYP